MTETQMREEFRHIQIAGEELTARVQELTDELGRTDRRGELFDQVRDYRDGLDALPDLPDLED